MDYWDDEDDDYGDDDFNDDHEGFSDGVNPLNPFNKEFGDFDKYFNDKNEFKFESLGEPDEKNPFMKNGVNYTEYKWFTEGGTTIRYVGIDGLKMDDITDGIMKSSGLSKKDLSSFIDKDNPLPLNFIRLLSASAKHNESMAKERVLTPEERIAELKDNLEIAVGAEDYEGAALIRDELKKLGVND